MRAIVNSELVKLIPMDMNELTAFIVRAKAATYVGDGEPVTPAGSNHTTSAFQTANGLIMRAPLEAVILSAKKPCVLPGSPSGR